MPMTVLLFYVFDIRSTIMVLIFVRFPLENLWKTVAYMSCATAALVKRVLKCRVSSRSS